MSEYIKLKDLAKYLHINRGDNIFVTSDVKQLLYLLISNDDDTDLNILIDGIIDIIGKEGTLVFPTFNWISVKVFLLILRRLLVKRDRSGRKH